ncbi:DUF421 domain-containing protein [Virgibacillus oceani]|uniref:DUF421 domain-containing protein n=1 Tax=Virgibacillus oceani TaxID=1479511 RepID=A0A917MAH2_9BACI|nr:DUF421 domain-containing protein [Virgibacillus oceani]GGG88025.1 hypothetical protein GCM10011398_37500 [Virgibacillus oceani]
MPEFILTLVRSTISFFLLLVMTRIMGKKQLSQMTFFDYVVGITIGSIAAAMAVDQNIKISNGIMGLLVWGIFPVILGLLGLKSMKFRHVTDGTPSIVIKDGKVQEKNLSKNHMSVDELMLSLREKNIFKVSDVEMAVMETNGQVSVMKKTEQQPITPDLIGLAVEKEHSPTIVISDGKLLKEELLSLGYSDKWLQGEIMKQGATTFEDVFLAQIDSKGNVYADLYNDEIQQQQVIQKPLLSASLKKVQADLESFSLQTDDPDAKKLYQLQADRLKKTLDSLLPYLK